MAEPMLSLMVLRTADLASARAFYEVLGLSFVEERHGSGPLHLSASLGKTVLELYPGQPGQAPNRLQAGAVMLGFNTDSIDDIRSKLGALGTRVVSEPKDSPWGRRMVVLDPDGRAIEVSEPLRSEPI